MWSILARILALYDYEIKTFFQLEMIHFSDVFKHIIRESL